VRRSGDAPLRLTGNLFSKDWRSHGPKCLNGLYQQYRVSAPKETTPTSPGAGERSPLLRASNRDSLRTLPCGAFLWFNRAMTQTLTYRNAAQRRQNAIGMLSFLYLPSDPQTGEAPFDLTTEDTREIAGNILKLRTLGRTLRWQSALGRWAEMVILSDDMRELRWAFLQGMVYASHASA